MSPDILIAAAEDANRREGERSGTRTYDLLVRPDGLMVDIRDYTRGPGPKKHGARGIIQWGDFKEGGIDLFRNSIDLLDAVLDRDLREALDA